MKRLHSKKVRALKMTDTCPICNNAGNLIRGKVKDDKKINVYRCEKCYLDFLETWNDDAEVNKIYENNNYVFKPNITGEKMKYDEYEGRFKSVFPCLKENTRLLDIGCGDGKFLKMVRPYVKEAEGTEITDIQVKELRKEGFKIWDCTIKEMKPSAPYDIICMFALLEHVPNVLDFLADLKSRFMHKNTQIFIEVPNLLDPLNSCYDIPEYRDFFYREYHLYYFTEKSIAKLLEKAGFESETRSILQATLTNHFHWMHRGEGQATTTDMANVVLPKKPLMNKTPRGGLFIDILDKVDDKYKDLMMKEGIGDLLSCRAWLAK